MEETKPGIRAQLKELLATGPLWLRVGVAVVFAVIGALGYRTCKHEPPAPTPVNVQPAAVTVAPPTVSVEPAPVFVLPTTESTVKPVGYHIFAARERHRVADELRSNGFALIGGPKKVDEKDVQRLLRHLEDDTIHGAAAETGALGDGSILRALLSVIRWPIDHPEEALRLLKFLLSLLFPLL